MPATLRAQIGAWAGELGFDDCRVLRCGPAPHWAFYEQWLARGNHAGMHYLERGAQARRDPSLLDADGVPLHTLLVLAVDYRQFELDPALRMDPARGLIASYAWGEDYHELIRPQLIELDRRIRQCSGRQRPGKAFVDAGPVLERDFAEQAGLGFTGKNTMTIRPGLGSQCFLATLAIPESLAADPVPDPAVDLDPMAVLAGLPGRQHFGVRTLVDATGASRVASCGQCERCLLACPTQAFVGPFHLDARRCIAYWTIETQELAPEALRTAFGNRIFGCDICQEVCPWNHRLASRAPRLPGLQARQQWIAPPLLEGFRVDTPYWLDPDAFAERFRRSPVKRAKRSGMLRNVCVALGNWADLRALPALDLAARDPAPAVREAVRWARGRMRKTLRSDDASVRPDVADT